MRIVLDASVIVKWFVPDPETEEHLDHARDVLERLRVQNIEALQPPHWLAEVAAVLVRVRSSIASEALELLQVMEIPVANDMETYRTALRLADELEHHVFDTLYHAVALERDCTLITADRRYFAKARRVGRIMSLQRWPPKDLDPSHTS